MACLQEVPPSSKRRKTKGAETTASSVWAAVFHVRDVFLLFADGPSILAIACASRELDSWTGKAARRGIRFNTVEPNFGFLCNAGPEHIRRNDFLFPLNTGYLVSADVEMKGDQPFMQFTQAVQEAMAIIKKETAMANTAQKATMANTTEEHHRRSITLEHAWVTGTHGRRYGRGNLNISHMLPGVLVRGLLSAYCPLTADGMADTEGEWEQVYGDCLTPAYEPWVTYTKPMDCSRYCFESWQRREDDESAEDVGDWVPLSPDYSP